MACIRPLEHAFAQSYHALLVCILHRLWLWVYRRELAAILEHMSGWEAVTVRHVVGGHCHEAGGLLPTIAVTSILAPDIAAKEREGDFQRPMRSCL
jgi:hypothetical protein